MNELMKHLAKVCFPNDNVANYSHYLGVPLPPAVRGIKSYIFLTANTSLLDSPQVPCIHALELIPSVSQLSHIMPKANSCFIFWCNVFISPPCQCPIGCMSIPLLVNNKITEHQSIDVGPIGLVRLAKHHISTTHVQSNISNKQKHV